MHLYAKVYLIVQTKIAIQALQTPDAILQPYLDFNGGQPTHSYIQIT